ncbi:MAG: tannase/feruloyl esterase family alpha/beta hydrolase [Alphaproteobacteria bacterium]|nr:tannase/feruloyl esterase family alpha/beta hydrolase [Alphaproteobacteria bacterium]
MRSMPIVLAGLLFGAPAFGDDAATCAALREVDFATLPDTPTQVISAVLVAARDILPAHCRVEGYIAPHVNFELLIPFAAWNGKLLHQGCGGTCGVIATIEADDALARGYAVVATDQGHRSTPADSKWAYNDLVAEVNAGYRATHATTVAATAIIGAVTGRPPARRYFRGCSNGGRQAMRAAQVFPGDYDGIIAGSAPPGGDATLNGLWGMAKNQRADGTPILTAPLLPVIHAAAVDVCDGDDGTRDGIISEPARCRFQPSTLRCGVAPQGACLTDEQIDVLQAIYDGPRNSTGAKLVIDSAGVGTELNWRGMIPENATDLASRRAERRLEALKYNAFWDDPGPLYKLADFDWDRDPPRMRLTAVLTEAANPDLRPFRDAGGKMMMSIGTLDYIPTRSMTDYYEAAERVAGGREATQAFLRMFVIPGMDHCMGGPGAWMIDTLTALERWVETGTPPDALIGHHPKDNRVFTQGFPASRLNREKLWRDAKALARATDFARPLFPYPDLARHDGKGAVTDPGSWVRVAP